MYLGAPLTFPLGGDDTSGGSPWIVNLSPLPEEFNAKLLSPIRFSIRDSETGIAPESVRVKVGYAKLFSNGDVLFDKIGNTKKIALGTAPAPESNISLIAQGVQIQRNAFPKQRSLYATHVEAGSGYESFMITAVVSPTVITPEISPETSSGPLDLGIRYILPVPYFPEGTTTFSNGTIIGIEHGPRRKVVYLWLQTTSSGVKVARATSFLHQNGDSPDLNMSTTFDWTGFTRYSLVWNEAEGIFEAYADVDSGTTRLFRIPINSIPTIPDNYYASAGDRTKLVGIYGQMGPSGDTSIWSNIAVTKDVGYPVLGTIRPGDFVTQIDSAVLSRFKGGADPRENSLASWFNTPESVIANKDPSGTYLTSGNLFILGKNTPGSTLSLYREEPGLLISTSEGFMIQASISASNVQLHGTATGCGITIFDGTSVFQLQLFDELGVRTLGLQKKGGDNHDITQYFLPERPFDWKDQRPFRIIVDGRRDVIRIYDLEDLSSPILDIPFDRSTLPSASDKGWVDKTPFIVFGHTLPLNTKGTFALGELVINHYNQSWDSFDGLLPTDALANPTHNESLSPGASASMDSEGYLSVLTTYNKTAKIYRDIDLAPTKGGVLEARLKVTSWRKNSRTGVYLFLDDGIRTYGLTFVENTVGKFAAVALRGNSGGFSEIVGRDGNGAKFSFLIDWTQFHTYRIERVPYKGLYIYVNNEPDPRITINESDLGQLPDAQFGGTPTLGFGNFSIEGATSKWDFVRTYFSKGYDISFKRNGPDDEIAEKINDSQVIVIAHAAD